MRYFAVPLLLLSTIILLWHSYPQTLISARRLSPAIREALLLRHLRKNHAFIAADNVNFKYIGRWTSLANSRRRDAGFQGLLYTSDVNVNTDTMDAGSRILFDVQNSTSIFLSLNNAARVPHSPDGIEVGPLFGERQSIGKSGASAPASITVGIDKQEYIYFDKNAHGMLRVAKNLSTLHTYHIDVELLGSSLYGESEALQVNGIWLSQGGSLQPTQDGVLRRQEKYEGTDKLRSTEASEQTSIVGLDLSIEVFSSISIRSAHIADQSSGWNFAKTLENNLGLTVVTIPIPGNFHLRRDCVPHQSSMSTHPTTQQLYFRAGPLGTTLFQRLRSRSLGTHEPSVLLLELGFWDVHSFLRHNPEPSKKVLDSFVQCIVSELVKFVLTIRRTSMVETSYKSTLLYQTTHRLGTPPFYSSTQPIDHSYTYNSAPSTLPIFLLPPPLPSTYKSAISSILLNVLAQTVKKLETVEGDKRTFLIDTTGWLENADFDWEPVLASPSTKSTVQSEAEMNFQPGTRIPLPNIRGHKKIASFLSLHLCPHLPLGHCRGASTASTLVQHEDGANAAIVTDKTIEAEHEAAHTRKGAGFRCDDDCPFERHNPYRGNVYVPDEALLGQLLEEKKIRRIQGFVDGESSTTHD